MGIMYRNASGEVRTFQCIGDADTAVLAQLIILRERVNASAELNSHEYHIEYPK